MSILTDWYVGIVGKTDEPLELVNGGWILWEGEQAVNGTPPVERSTEINRAVQVLYRDLSTNVSQYASALDWSHGDEADDLDIIAYRHVRLTPTGE